MRNSKPVSAQSIEEHTGLPPHILNPQPLLVVISGPSGVGKDAVLRRMRERGYPFHFVVTVTTRPPRPEEIHGVDYFFISEEEYDRLLGAGELLEHATVYGYRYGVPKQQVREAWARGQDVLIRVDVQGDEDLERRMATARAEMERLHEFDYVVVNSNGRLDEAVARIMAIIQAEKCRVRPRKISL